MGQKIKPYSLRLGITKNWSSRWFGGDYKYQLEEDVLIRRIIKEKLEPAGIVKIDIERGSRETYRIFIKAARPGLIIGRGGKGIEELNKQIEKKLIRLFKERKEKKTKFSISLNVEELKRAEVSAQNMAQNIAWDLEKRRPARGTMKKYLENIMQYKDAQGAKIRLSGRIDGAEISRREWVSKGKLPLQTLRADIDYGEATAFCNYGTVGVKVWIYKGEIFNEK